MVINHLQVLAWSSKWFRHGNQEVEVGVFHEVKIAGKVYERSGSWGMDAQGSWGGTGWTSVGSDMLGLLGWLEDTSTKRWSTFFFCWCKKNSPQKTTKVMVSFWGNPKQNLGGDIEVYIEVHIRSIFLARFFWWPEKKHCPPKLYQLLFFWTHALNVTNVVLVGNWRHIRFESWSGIEFSEGVVLPLECGFWQSPPFSINNLRQTCESLKNIQKAGPMKTHMCNTTTNMWSLQKNPRNVFFAPRFHVTSPCSEAIPHVLRMCQKRSDGVWMTCHLAVGKGGSSRDGGLFLKK